MMHGLTTSTGVIDGHKLVELVEMHRPNMEVLLERRGWLGRISVDAALAIWLYTLEDPSVFQAVNMVMFAEDRR